MINMKFYLKTILFILLISQVFYFVKADDNSDDDDIFFRQLIFDIMIGFSIALCEKSENCTIFLSIFIFTYIILFILICLCCSYNTRKDIFKSLPNNRNIIGTGIGYGLGRLYR